MMLDNMDFIKSGCRELIATAFKVLDKIRINRNLTSFHKIRSQSLEVQQEQKKLGNSKNLSIHETLPFRLISIFS